MLKAGLTFLILLCSMEQLFAQKMSDLIKKDPKAFSQKLKTVQQTVDYVDENHEKIERDESLIEAKNEALLSYYEMIQLSSESVVKITKEEITEYNENGKFNFNPNQDYIAFPINSDLIEVQKSTNNLLSELNSVVHLKLEDAADEVNAIASSRMFTTTIKLFATGVQKSLGAIAARSNQISQVGGYFYLYLNDPYVIMSEAQFEKIMNEVKENMENLRN